MMTMSGNRMGMMVNPPGFHLANITPPKLTPEEEARRKAMLQQVRQHDKAKMKKCQTDDRSAPIVSGKRSVPGGWVDCGGQGGGESINPMAKAQQGLGKGKGRGAGGLGDLFAGGFKPNPGALRPGGVGRGRGK